ncbi:MAG: alpha/beta hydrolase [Nocardioides sp.]
MNQTDVLGPPYTSERIDLPSDEEGEVVATLVKRAAEVPADRAVLHVHGFCDYFFQTEYAEWWNARGYDFYAVDLRKYGRSLLPHQTPNYVADLSDHFAEFDEVWQRITERDEHHRVVISAHSTGGLTAPLWADARQPAELAGLFLNSPWLDLQGSAAARLLLSPVVTQIGRFKPSVTLPRGVDGLYGRALHKDHGGEFDFNLDWKPLDSFPVALGWLRAVRSGHARLQRGLNVSAPVLVMASDRSTRATPHSEDLYSSDVVLDVKQIRRWATAVGPQVGFVTIPGGIHDLILSPEPARSKVYAELERWLAAYVE